MSDGKIALIALLGVIMLAVSGINLFRYLTSDEIPRTKEEEDADEQGFGF